MARELLDIEVARVTPGALMADLMVREDLGPVVLQEMNEERFNRKHIDKKIRKAIEENPDMAGKIEHGVQLVTSFIGQAHTYVDKDGVEKPLESKNNRIAQLKNMDIPALVMDIFIGISYCLREELFTSVTGQIASRLKFSDRAEAILTVAELLAVLCETDAFDIIKESKEASFQVQSAIPLPDNLITFIQESQCLPPMVCEPLELTHNFSSGYLTHNDSLILGSGNHHDGDICLDVLNLMNKVPLKLSTDFLSKVEEDASDITPEGIQEKAAKKGEYLSLAKAKERVLDAMENWNEFKQQSYMFYSLMEQQGNRFYFTHKVDKRGRIYNSGYHISTQGAPFKKAMLEFAEEEIVEGVPT